jgi:hypothetical protein
MHTLHRIAATTAAILVTGLPAVAFADDTAPPFVPDAADRGRAPHQSLVHPDTHDSSRPPYQSLVAPDTADLARDVSAPSLPVTRVVAAQPVADGFDWGDAGIGAAGGLALLTLAGGLGAAAMRWPRLKTVAR